MRILALISLSLLSILGASAQQCGSQAGGKVCPGGLCCSKFGFCGTTATYCTSGCQSNCNTGGGGSPNTLSPTPSGGGGHISSLISKAVFEKMLKHRNSAKCEKKGFYTYEAFIAAAKAFGGFATIGNDTTKKREIAAFFAQTSHETTGGSPTGPYEYGYCFVTEQNKTNSYCDGNQQQIQQYPCAAGKKYFGRGPIQLTHHYNYGQAGKAKGIKRNLLADPDLVATNATISFKTALWFWMTPQHPKPSSHNVITGRWTPSNADKEAGRVPGYGVITNIINGGKECGKGSTPQQDSRIGFYKRYSGIMGVDTGKYLDCNSQKPFA